MADDRVEVGGERVVVVAARRLARLAEAATVVRDDALPRGEERRGLLFPRRAVQWVAVDQDDGVALAVVFVIEMDIGGVLLPTVT
jgi:hypothetical protein